MDFLKKRTFCHRLRQCSHQLSYCTICGPCRCIPFLCQSSCGFLRLLSRYQNQFGTCHRYQFRTWLCYFRKRLKVRPRSRFGVGLRNGHWGSSSSIRWHRQPLQRHRGRRYTPCNLLCKLENFQKFCPRLLSIYLCTSRIGRILELLSCRCASYRDSSQFQDGLICTSCKLYRISPVPRVWYRLSKRYELVRRFFESLLSSIYLDRLDMFSVKLTYFVSSFPWGACGRNLFRRSHTWPAR